MLYFRLCGSPPFKARDEETLYEYIKKGEINFHDEHIKNCTESGVFTIQNMFFQQFQIFGQSAKLLIEGGIFFGPKSLGAQTGSQLAYVKV